ncbi:MAG TPA: apolipoprotein N-acyltransferase [Sphingomicrobium sp.]|nr:apolipoprotein N-acyltransferase [Sphingomicrobium sp.]
MLKTERLLAGLTRHAFPTSIALGALSALAFEPLGWWPLMPAAFALLSELVWRAGSLRNALAIGWGFGVGQFVVGLNWIATSFTYQSEMPAWLGWIAVVLLSLYLAVYPMLATGLGWRLGGGRRLALLLALAGGWGITEWLRATMFTGFAWNPVGVVLVPTPLLGTSALIGTYGLSILVVLLGGAIWLELHRRFLRVVLILAGVALLWALPAAKVAEEPTVVRPVRIVQPNIGQQDKWRPGFSEEAARRLAGLSAPRHPDAGPRLLLWPEAAVTNPLEDARTGEHQAMAEYERTRAAALLKPGDLLLTGGLALFASDGRRVDGAANSVFVIGERGQVLGRYDKAHLVPYGEYLPMRPLLSAIGLSRLAPGDVDFTPGPGPRTVDLGKWGKVGFQVCYEIIFSGDVVDPRNRPDFIFNPSNDAWFGRWGPPQHLAQARLRAAEEGIPVLRSTPTGISAIIDGHGHVISMLPWRTAGAIDGVLPPSALHPTVFAQAGNLIPLTIGFLMMFAAIALSSRRRYRRT